MSVYSGGGGMDVGFHQAGFTTIFATDHWEPACETLRHNGVADRVECADIREIDFVQVLEEAGLDSIDCLIGGPPCPAFSKSRFYRKEKARALEDENSFTVAEYFRAVEETRPTVFVFENVFGFVYKPHADALAYVQQRSMELGYSITWQVVNAADYGVPQIRERFICVGIRTGLPAFEFPAPTNAKPGNANLLENGLPDWVTTGDVIADLDVELPEDELMKAGSKHHDLLVQVPPGDNYLYFTEERGHPNPVFKWRSRYWSFLLKLSPDKPSWTIQASHSNNMGPFHWRNRFLRISEIKRIQTFPDDYWISGDYRTQWRQVGNAVPPLLAFRLAQAILDQYFESHLSDSGQASSQSVRAPANPGIQQTAGCAGCS